MKFRTFLSIFIPIVLIVCLSMATNRVKDWKQGGVGEPDNIIEELTDDAIEYAFEDIAGYDAYIETIKSMNIPGYSCTFGRAFSNFFSDPQWEHYTSRQGNEIIQFTGGCTYDGQYVTAMIQFTVTDEYGDYIEADVTHMTLDGITQGELMTAALIATVAEECP